MSFKALCFKGLSIIFSLIVFAGTGKSGTANYIYDDEGRIVRVDSSDGSSVHYSYDHVGNRQSKSTTLSSSPANNPPNLPDSPSPLDTASSIDSSALLLSWTGGDPDQGDITIYEVYFGLTSPPSYFGMSESNSFVVPATLESQKTYFWQVIAKDSQNSETASEVWSFTTANNSPTIPQNISPLNSALISPVDSTLNWVASDPNPDDTINYDIYLSETDPPVLYVEDYTGESYVVSPLTPEKTYYWQIIAKDDHNSVIPSPVWNFTTNLNNPPPSPDTPSPADGVMFSPHNLTLSWNEGVDPDPGDLVSYDIYFGSTSPPPLLVSDYSGTSYVVGHLAPDQTYYWKVIAKDYYQAEGVSPEWSFDTFIEPVVMNNIVIFEDTTFTKEGGPYIISGGMTVDSDVTLTIEPGTVLKFEPYALLDIYGRLIAQGSVSQEIIFTSFADDQYAGDTNGDGNLSQPAFADWKGINFINSAIPGSIIEYSIVKYGGGDNANIYISDVDVTVRNSAISESGGPGIQLYNSSSEISNCTITNNPAGIYAGFGAPVIEFNNLGGNSAYDLDYYGDLSGRVSSNNFGSGGVYLKTEIAEFYSNTIVYNQLQPLTIQAADLNRLLTANTIINSGPDNIAIDIYGNIIREDTHLLSGYDYRIKEEVTVLGTDGPDGVTTVAIDPGVELHFDVYTRLVIGATSGDPGAISAVGTSTEPILFTANTDTPSPAYWKGIEIFTTADATNSQFDHCIIEYGGGSNANIYINNAYVPVTNSTLRKSGNIGVFLDNSSSEVSNCTINNNDASGIYLRQSDSLISDCAIISNSMDGINVESGSPVIVDSSIMANNLFGITNNTLSQIVAENNWWGDASGPLDPSDDIVSGGLYNPAGQGDQVTDYIDYDPWLSADPQDSKMPQAEFSATPLTGDVPLSVSFMNESTSEQNIESWLWDFGDGNTSSARNPTNIFLQPGSHTVSLTVTETDGDFASETKQDYIMIFPAIAQFGSVIDAPHNQANMACGDCHSYQLWWQYSPTSPTAPAYRQNADDVCMKCHDSSGPALEQHHHSSANSSEKYGVWSQVCIDCHDTHFQKQLDWRVTESGELYIVTGDIGPVASFSYSFNSTTFDYVATSTQSEWVDPATWSNKNSTIPARGLIFVEDTVNAVNTFEITAADAASITVKGYLGLAAAGQSFGMIYGQLIKPTIDAPNGIGPRSVKFFNPTSTSYGFTNNSATPEGVCQVCHSQTTYWLEDGLSNSHESGKVCTDCHPADQGFPTNFP